MPTVEYSQVIDGDTDRVWSTVKKFGELAKWHPAIADSSIENDMPDGMVGCIRKLTLRDGGELTERLLSVDDRNLQLCYNFEKSPLPLDNYVGTVKLARISNKPKTYISWSSRFDVRVPEQPAQYEKAILDLIVEGIASLEEYVATGRASS